MQSFIYVYLSLLDSLHNSKTSLEREMLKIETVVK